MNYPELSVFALCTLEQLPSISTYLLFMPFAIPDLQFNNNRYLRIYHLYYQMMVDSSSFFQSNFNRFVQVTNYATPSIVPAPILLECSSWLYLSSCARARLRDPQQLCFIKRCVHCHKIKTDTITQVSNHSVKTECHLLYKTQALFPKTQQIPLLKITLTQCKEHAEPIELALRFFATQAPP